MVSRYTLRAPERQGRGVEAKPDSALATAGGGHREAINGPGARAQRLSARRAQANGFPEDLGPPYALGAWPKINERLADAARSCRSGAGLNRARRYQRPLTAGQEAAEDAQTVKTLTWWLAPDRFYPGRASYRDMRTRRQHLRPDGIEGI